MTDEPMQNAEHYPPTAGSQMPDVLDQLPNVPLPIKRTARVLADVVGMTQWAVGKNPTSLAGTCVYMAGLVHRDQIPQAVLSENDIAGEITIRGQYRKIPEKFLDNADEEDLERFNAGETLPDSREMVVKRLRLFREAEEEGPGINRLDHGEDGA